MSATRTSAAAPRWRSPQPPLRSLGRLPRHERQRRHARDRRVQQEPIPVQLLSFNDFHGHVEQDPASTTASVTELRRARRSAANGRAAYLATHLQQLREGHPNSFTVAAGDLIGGSTFTSGVFHDEPAVETLNAMDLDVSSVGNHEFDEGVTELLRMQNGGCHPVDGCFQQDATGNGHPLPRRGLPVPRRERRQGVDRQDRYCRLPGSSRSAAPRSASSA